MNRLERWIAERDGRLRVAVEIDGRPCEAVSTLTVDVRDWDALLAVAEAAAPMMLEPFAISVRGRLLCTICEQDVIMGGHAEDCAWRVLADALAPLLEGIDDRS